MASTSKASRRCVDPCPRYLTPDDTHDCCVFCLGEGHARDVLDGAICVHCELFSMRKLRSRLSLFSSKEGQPSASRDSRPTVAEARRRMKSWVSQVYLADELERELSLSHESARNEGEPLDHDDAISLTSSDPAASALLGYAQEEQEMGEEVETELSQISCPAYKELLEVMERATVRLDLPWERTKMAAPRGHLDERYLSGHKRPVRVSLPFLPDLHTAVEKEWKKPFSSRIHRFQHTSYANIEKMLESGYEKKSRSEPEQSRGPGSSWSEDRRRAQKATVATRAPCPPTGRGRGRYRSKRGRQDLRKVIQTERPQQRSRLGHSKD